MDSWKYQEYLDSVKQDMEFGVKSRQYNVEEAFGFAHDELLSRLEEFPDETTYALTALAVCLNEYGKLSTFTNEDGFYNEISTLYKSDQLRLARDNLNEGQVKKFDSDVNIVKGVLGI